MTNHKYKIRVPIVDGYRLYTHETVMFGSNEYHALAKVMLQIRGADDIESSITIEEIE